MLPIYLYGHPVLREISQDITQDYPNLKELIEKMRQSMYESDGIGLAAPQIGKNIRLIVIDARPLAEEFPECAELNIVLINAHIEEFGNDVCSEVEGCLSLPGIHEKVERPSAITISYMDENWQSHRETFSGFAARVIQHEYDHLEGFLFVDRLSPLRKQLVRGKLLSINKGKVRTHYPIVVAPVKRK